MSDGDQSNELVFNRNNPVTDSVRRLTWTAGTAGTAGTGGAGGAGRPAGRTAVCKTLRGDGQVVVAHWTTSEQPSHWNYWRREDLAYRTALVDVFAAAGLRGPHLLERVQRPDGSVELWLEHVDGRTGSALTLEDHRRIHRRLGLGQAWVATEDASWRTLPWLSRGWLRNYATTRLASDAVYHDAAAWEHPAVVAGLGEDRHHIRRSFAAMWRESPRWFDLLDRLPRTLCHLDHWPNNAIAASDGSDVLIDWSFAGDGAVGEDPGNWVPDTFFDHFMEPERFGELDDAVWTAYANGLSDAGWDHDLRFARLGMCASAVKYLWLPGLMVRNAEHQGPTGYGGRAGHDLETVFARRAVIWHELLAWLDEARGLAARLGVDR